LAVFASQSEATISSFSLAANSCPFQKLIRDG